MVDLTQDIWSRPAARSPLRAVGSVLVVVGVTAGVVLGARQVFSFDNLAPVGAWATLAGVAGFVALRRFASHPDRDRSEEGGAAPVVIRRDGTPVQGEARRHRRFIPARRATRLHMRDGREIPARIVDISIAGVAIEARITELEFLSVVRVGSRAAGPVRRTSVGAVFGFEALLEPQPFDASFVL